MSDIKDFDELFAAVDKNGDGTVSFQELLVALKNSGYAGSDDEIKMVFESMDKDFDGNISKDEFLNSMSKAPRKVHVSSEWRRVFRQFDKDNSGFIDRSELDQIFREMGNPKKGWEIDRLVEICDKDKDGKISYEEFIAEIVG